jgi:hypothetical protein
MAMSMNIHAQDVQNSRQMSQKVSIASTIGTTQIKINYHTPLAKGRKIFGGIVPYDFVVDGKEYAWRAGSNERTTIEFGHNVEINGNPLSAGKYGLVVLVSEKEWTYVFSTDMSWGAFQYTPERDVLRVKVPVKKQEYQDWLSYSFVKPQAEKVDVELRWVDVSAAFTISTNITANILGDLEAKPNKSADDYGTLSIECMNQNQNSIDKALGYLELGLARIDSLDQKSRRYTAFSLNMLKADLLIQKGETKKGNALKKVTIEKSEGFDMYYYGLNTLIVKGNQKEAFQLLSDNIKRNPRQWQAYLAMGEYYLKAGDQQRVVDNFKLAYEYASDNWKNYARYLYLQNKLVLERN